MTKTRKIGPIRVRPHIRNGMPTGRWVVDIPASVTGYGQRKRKLFDNQRTALEIARRLKRELELRAFGETTTRRSGVLLHEAVEWWLEAQAARVRTLKIRSISLKGDRYRLKTLLAFFGRVDLTMITATRIVEYQEWRIGQGKKPSTINTAVATLSKVLRWAVKQGYLNDLPEIEYIPHPPPDIEIPTKEEVVRLLQVLPERLRPLVWFIAETGARAGEAYNLTWDCVDEVNGIVEFKAKDGWTPKTRQSQRRIYITGDLLDAIRSLPKTGRYVFPGHRGDKPRTQINTVLSRAVRRANLMRNGKPMRITCHVLRKAYATWLAMDGVPQQVLQARLGHARGSRITDQYYVFATEDAKRAAVIELPVARTDQRHK